MPCDVDLDEEASMPESLPSDTETEQLVETTELADEPLAKFNIHVWMGRQEGGGSRRSKEVALI